MVVAFSGGSVLVSLDSRVISAIPVPHSSAHGTSQCQNDAVTTARQRVNLRRGGIPASAESAARARAGKAARARELDRLGQLARDDPWKAYGELHAVMARHITTLLRDEERSGAKPSREVTDRLREYRATTEALTSYGQTAGHTVQAESFFGDLASRIDAIAPGFLEAAAEDAFPLTQELPPDPEPLDTPGPSPRRRTKKQRSQDSRQPS